MWCSNIDGQCFLDWSHHISGYLKLKECWDVIIETPPIKWTDELLSEYSSTKDPQKSELKDIYNDWKAWCAKDNKAVGILTMKMKSELQTFIKDSARETWSALQESFGKSGLPGIFADYKLFKN